MRRIPIIVAAVVLATAILLLARPALVSAAGAEVKTFTQTVRQAFGGSQSPDDARIAAIAKAKREALEKAGTFLETLQIIQDGRLDRDKVLILASGILKTEVISTRNYVTGEAFGIEVVARVEVDTSILERRVMRVLNDQSLIQRLVETRKRETNLLKRVAGLESRNRELQGRAESRETDAARTSLKQQFAALTKGLSAAELNNKALAFWRNGGFTDPDQAILLLDQAIRLDPQHAVTFTRRGIALMNKRQYDRAIADFSEAIRLDPRNAITFTNRGIAYKKKGRYGRAFDDYNDAIRLNLNHAPAFSGRGTIFFRDGEYDRAIADYSEALRLKPLNATTYYNRGLTFERKARYDRAIQDFDAAIRLNPRFAEAFTRRGGIYEKLGRQDEAIRDFKKIYDLGVRSAWLVDRLKAAGAIP